MERLKLKYDTARKALNTLVEIAGEPYSLIVRDAAIQRFEYTFEAVWKFLREYLKEIEGIVCNSPKSCFREAMSLRLLNDDETVKFLEMTDSRNETTHIYQEEIAEKIYNKIADYSNLMKGLLERLGMKI